MGILDTIKSLAGGALRKLGDIFPFFKAFEGFQDALQGAIKYSLTAQDSAALAEAIAYGREGASAAEQLLAELNDVFNIVQGAIEDDGAIDINEVQEILAEIDDLSGPATEAVDALISATKKLKEMVQ